MSLHLFIGLDRKQDFSSALLPAKNSLGEDVLHKSPNLILDRLLLDRMQRANNNNEGVLHVIGAQGDLSIICMRNVTDRLRQVASDTILPKFEHDKNRTAVAMTLTRMWISGLIGTPNTRFGTGDRDSTVELTYCNQLANL